MQMNSDRPGDHDQYSGFNKILKSKAVQFIIDKVDDGTYREFFGDCKWIFSFSKKYKNVIIFYTFLGIFSTTLSLVSSVASKYMIDIITGYEFSKLWVLAVIMVTSTAISLAFSSLVSRYSAKLTIYVNNDIKGIIFDLFLVVVWL